MLGEQRGMMWETDDRATSRLSNLRFLNVSRWIIVFGAILLLLSELLKSYLWSWVSAVMGQLGALLVGTGAISVVWEVMGRRALMRELMELAGLADDIRTSGLKRISTNYLENATWRRLFENATTMDVFASYANTWRETFRSQIAKVANKESAQIRILLPDTGPENEVFLSVLAARSGKTPEEYRAKVDEAKVDFENILESCKGDSRIYACRGDRLFAVYRLDEKALVTLYPHSLGKRGDVPTLVVEGGYLYDFLVQDIEAAVANGRVVWRSRAD